MKTQNKKKIIVSTLALAMGAALAGSISGSVAWYQYSTRAAVQFTGTSAGTEGRLQVKVGSTGAYAQTVKLSDGEDYRPISGKGSVGAMEYYDHPVYQTAQLPVMLDSNKGYVDYELYFKYEENTNNPQSFVQEVKNVYLSYFEIENTGTNDVTPAVRVELLGSNSFLFSANDAGETVNTKGKLDLNSNTKDDRDYWDCLDVEGNEIEYTTGADSYATQAHSAALVEVTDANVYDLDTGNSAKILTATKASGDSEKLTVRVWLEGWALLNGSANWSADYIAQNFNINMQFACSATR